MASRKVFGTILRTNNEQPWANARVTFILKVGSFTSSAQYPKERVEAKTNAAGYFEAMLWANSDGLLATTYICKLPDNDEFEFRLSNGATPVNLSELRGLGGISTQAPQTLLQQLEPYFLSQSQGDGRYRKLTASINFSDLTGSIGESQVPGSIARSSDVASVIAQHLATADPHPQYLTAAEGAALVAASGLAGTTNLTFTRDATTVSVFSDTGTDVILPAATPANAGVMAASDKSKLDGIAAGAINQTAADARYRQLGGSISAIEISGTLTDAQIPGLIARDAEVTAAIAAITPASIGADVAGNKTLTPTPTDPGNTATNSAFLSWLISATRGAQASLSGLGALANKSTIADIDVAAGAAIAWSKISKAGAAAADIGAIAASEKGAVNGVASLVGGKVPAAQSRGCNVAFNAATGVFDFTWPDGSTQSVDTVIEQLLQASNYSSATKTITFTRANGTTFDVPIADLVDLPEVFIATQNPVSAPTTGQRLYLRSDTGEYWINSGVAWAGPFLNVTAAERTKLAGIAAGAQVNTVNSVAGKTGAVALVKADVGLGAVDNTADADKPISTATATALAARELTAARTLTPIATDPGNTATINGFLSWLISAVRTAQTTLSGLGSLAAKSTISNADVAAGAAIDVAKLSGVQPGSVNLTAIAGLNTTGLIERTGIGSATTRSIGAGGAAVVAAADQVAVRAAAGLDALTPATITVPGSAIKNVLQTTRPIDLNNQALTNFYLANSVFSGQSGGLGIFVDRLQAAYQKYNITTTGNIDLSAAFDSSYETPAYLGSSGPSAAPMILEIDFSPLYTANGAASLSFWTGLIAIHFYDNYFLGYVSPASVKVEIEDPYPSPAWVNVGTFAPVNNSTAIKDEALLIPVPNAGQGLTKMRFTFNMLPVAGFQHYATKIEYYAGRPDAWELPQYLLSASGVAVNAKIPSLTIENKARTAKTIVGQGTLQFNNGATQTASLRGVKTVNAPSTTDTITVTGAQVGDIARLSEAVGGKVTALNTVTFDSTGLNGISVTAIVERFI